MPRSIIEHATLGQSASFPILERYYEQLKESVSLFETPVPQDEFEPPFALPELDERMRNFLSVATAELVELGTYGGVQIRLLDLRQNAGTQTTKTFASTMIVARAVHYIQKTGQPVILFSPSSGNKAIALRDAVERALISGLANPRQLRIATLTPQQTLHKLRSTSLSEEPELRALNPVFVLDHPLPEQVKQVGNEFKEMYRRKEQTGQPKLWHSLKINNYRFADQARAFFDLEFGSAGKPGHRTVHAHSVSSAYGLLGYQSGLDTLRKMGRAVSPAQYLLVQHLATSDMVRHLLTDTFDDSVGPDYRLTNTGVWQQLDNPHFPMKTWDPDEVLENTFYTHRPVTASEMTRLIKTQGGSGIVVSLLECMERYGECRSLLKNSAISLPADPRCLKEWSLVMATTGVLSAIDRGLLSGIDSCTLHASGSYADQDFKVLPTEHLTRVSNAQQMLAAL